ncbi:MerR family transcriptional regulator [Pedobacter endophyticus]|uniref:MerR family transcriptional regulator n=1 Tax=Pedobacter endophyticus TaxID=2789740 RepID=A0A7S9L213_9SPHI|nr:MerR family transcriptional regulator [Pedobacter endophyticus]QPH40789.1 MerR family transcriptional regulator [Pedobacter endophyticus]
MTYTISDLEQLSGIQSHTIRIWEQRYNALQPMRSEGNTRLYDDDQLRRLLNIASLNKTGLKISKICNLSPKDFSDLVDQTCLTVKDDALSDYYVSQLIKYGISFDEPAFAALLDKGISDLGIQNAYRKVIYPLLVRLGVMWQKDDICPAHEHFLTHIIKQKLLSAVNDLGLQPETADTWLLFLPEDEDHDIGLIFANYMLRANGHKVIYLGSKVPLQSLQKVLKTVNVNRVLFFMVRSRLPVVAQKYIDELTVICQGIKIHVAGNNQLITKLKSIGRINWLKSLDEFDNAIQKTNLL